MRLTVAVSGGADSVALLRALLTERTRPGLVLSVAHVHHGIRGAEADEDAAFVEELAGQFSLPFYLKRVDVPGAAKASGKTVEEAARHLRYSWFWELIDGGAVDAVATAHTLDDQAETVLHRLLRGAWTEGLGGIYPIIRRSRGNGAKTASSGEGGAGELLRPFLEVRRVEIEAWLLSIDQPWREDSSNSSQAYTRNRVRHSLLPELTRFNPKVAGQLSQVATLARDEEDYWQGELRCILPSMLLPGRSVRGGGRGVTAGEASVSIEVERLRALHPALRRRVLRAAAGELGVVLDFAETDLLLSICDAEVRAAGGRGVMVGAQLTVSRSVREIRLTRAQMREDAPRKYAPEYVLPVPGEVVAEAFGVRVRAELKAGSDGVDGTNHQQAVVRRHRPGDRVRLRHSRGPCRVKEIFERLQLAGQDRDLWPLVEWEGEIVWMRGVEVESGHVEARGLVFTGQSIDRAEPGPDEELPGTLALG
ncbi:MAG TPA: tRNA lysidine(34) synthetase TilS [Acidisarcina sp.]